MPYSLLYVGLVSCFACLLAEKVRPFGTVRDPVSDGLAWVVLAATLFFGPFHLLGFAELVSGHSLVSTSTACAVLGTGLAVFLLWRRTTRRKRGEPEASPSPLLQGWKPGVSIGSVMLGLLLAGAAFIAVVRVTGFPIGTEGEAYHLPIGVHIFQSGSLRIWDPGYMHTYPANQSLYLGFLLGFLPERLVAAANVPLLLCLAGAMFALGRSVTRDFRAVALMTAGLVSMPIVIRAADLSEADLGGLTFLAIATFFAFETTGSGRTRPVLAGLAMGIAFGFKSLHLVGFLVVGVLVLVRERSLDGASDRAGRALARFCLATGVASSFWLVRNYAQLGNPLYPVFVPGVFSLFGWTEPPDIALLGRLETQGDWVDAGWQWLIFPWSERPAVILGPFFAVVFPAAVSIAGWHAARNKISDRVAIRSLLFSGLFIVAIWWLLGDRQPRYCLGALVFLGPLVAWTMARLSGRARALYESLMVVSILFTLTLALAPNALDLVRRTVLTDQWERHRFYQYPQVIDELSPGSVIVNLGFAYHDPGDHSRHWHYPLMGKHLRNRIISFPEALRLFATDPYAADNARRYRLRAGELRNLGATHLWMVGDVDISLEEGVSLNAIGRLDENPIVGTPFDQPRVLFEIVYP